VPELLSLVSTFSCSSLNAFVRTTVETMLQKLGVDKEVRPHLLSHGRTRGVQGQHYERYDFLDEKR
jgi:hypothetical protein